MPSWDFTIGHYTVVPNPFWGGAAFPLAAFGFLFLWPWLEHRFGGDTAYHNLLDRPRDAPWRTAIGFAVLTWVFLVFVAGSADRVDVLFNLSYSAQIWFYRGAVLIGPLLAGFVAYRACISLQRGEIVERDRRRAEEEARAA